jgi:PAS domain S-box-containing protein
MSMPKDKNLTSSLSILDRMPGVLFEYHLPHTGRGVFTYVSPRADEILGISRDKLLMDEDPIESFILPEDVHSFQKTFQQSLEEGKEFHWEGRVWAGNNIIWLQVAASLSSTEETKQVWHGLMLDVTDRKRAEQTQSESDQRYKALLDQMPLGVAVHREGKLLFVNPHACQIMGATNKFQLEGREILDLVHPDYHSRVIERIKKVAAGEQVAPAEEKLIRLDGTIAVVEVHALPVVYEGQAAIQIVVRDRSEEKRTEREIRLQEIFFTQLFAGSPMAIIMLDNRGNVVKVNDAFENLFGFTREELINRSLNDFIVPEHLTNEGNDLDTLISSKNVVRFETFRLHKNKSRVNVIIYGVPVQMENEAIGIFGTYVDITERKRVEEELKIRNTELDNFVYKVSHDLRAPLSSIRGLTNLAAMPGNTDSPEEYLKLIGQKVDQLDHFISDILSHSKNLKMEVTNEKIDFRKMIEQIFIDLNYLKGAQEIETILSIDDHAFYNDPWRVAEVMRNLISNAIKYRRFTISNPKIRIHISVDQREAFMEFSDNGIGIDQKSLTRIFEMFYRASGQSEGSGIGLYIVKNAIDKLGGHMQVESEINKGTTFRITLPNRIQSS